MPKLWNETIATHRQAVRDAILEATWKLVSENGLASVTMSQIAQEVGIGRATLYKYFPDVETILVAWHDRTVAGHLASLDQYRHQPGDGSERLRAALEAYALISFRRGRHGAELGSLLHRNDQVNLAQQQLIEVFRDLLAESSNNGGDLRTDVPLDELSQFCFHSMNAAGELPTEDAVDRLVNVTMSGLRTPK